MVAHPPYDVAGVSGTEINKLIAERNIKQWSRLSFSSIYYILSQLQRKKLIELKKAENDLNEQNDVGAPQRLFIATSRGLKVLKKTVIHYFQSMDLNYQEMNLALAAAFVFDDNEFLMTIQNYKKHIDERIKVVRGRFIEDNEQTGEEALPIHVWALFNYAFYSLNARNDFLKKLTDILEKKLHRERMVV